MPRKYSKRKSSKLRKGSKPRRSSKRRTLKRKSNKRGGGYTEFDLDFRYISPDVTFNQLQINRCINLNEDQSIYKQCASGSFSTTFLAEEQKSESVKSVELLKPKEDESLGLDIDHSEEKNLYIRGVKAEAVKELKEVAKIGSKLVSINAEPIKDWSDFVSKYSKIKQNSEVTLGFEQEYAMKIYKKKVEPSLSKSFYPLIIKKKQGESLGLDINNDTLTLEGFKNFKGSEDKPYNKSNKVFYESYIGQRISSVNETPVKTIGDIISQIDSLQIGDKVKFDFFYSNRDKDFMYVEKGNNAHEKLQKLINREDDSELKDENFYIVKLLGHGIVREAASSSKKLSINQPVLYQNNVYDGALFSICEKGMSVDLFEFCLNPGAIYNINKTKTHENKKKLIINILTQIATALHFIHINGFIHYDLKPENVILLNYVENYPNSIRIRLIDFDFLVTKEEAIENPKTHGTREYKAPEVNGFMKYDHTAKLDIFSFGILILDLIINLEKKSAVDMLIYERISPNYKFLNNKKKNLDPSLKEFINPEIDPEYKLFDLFKSCVKTDPELRPDASEILRELQKLRGLRS
jgi:serine/threonine protein kinase